MRSDGARCGAAADRALTTLLVVLLILTCFFRSPAWAWGPEGHSIIGEIAQRRLTPTATAELARLLGPNHSLSALGSWADDERDRRPETYNWHFVDIPLAEDHYSETAHCKPDPKGDCVVAALLRLRSGLRCAATDAEKRDSLRFAVHFVGDIHQPLHTVDEARGGNDIPVEVRLRGSLTCRTGPCPPLTQRSNFHRIWDSTLITRTTWSWGSYVDRLEDGWLKSPEVKGADSGTVIDWAEETHRAARLVWERLSERRTIDDDYYQAVLPVLDRQLGTAGIRLAQFLNDAYSSNICPRP